MAELRAQPSLLSSAASYGSKLPWPSSTKQCCTAAAAGRGGRRAHGRGEGSSFHTRTTMERRVQAAAAAAAAAADSGLKKTPQNKDLPPVVLRHKKKPWITPPKPGGFLCKLKRGPPQLRRLPAPANGLLVPNLIPVAHQVLQAHASLIRLVPKLMQVLPVKVCKSCAETHVGPVGHGIATCNGPNSASRRSRHIWTRANSSDVIPSLDTFHLYDRLKTIHHEERFGVERLPALLELCIQAGVELPEYPVLRRTRPVKAIGRRIVEEDVSLFEFDDEEMFNDTDSEEDSVSNAQGEDEENGEYDSAEDLSLNTQEEHRETSALGVEDELGIDAENDSQEEALKPENVEQAAAISKILDADLDMLSLSSEEVAHVAETTLKTWEVMRNGAKRLMTRYPVRVCGYCPEVHIGPRGHKVKMCGAFKHQWRAGQHGWQKATINDLIPPKYVWHVQNLQAPLLENQLRRYYGQAPAIVELCVQGGAPIPDEFRPMMRVDVVVPDVDEIYNVV